MRDKIKLTPSQIDFLSGIPESGMGYQIVNLILKNKKVLKKRIVLNSSFLKKNENEEINVEDIIKIELV